MNIQKATISIQAWRALYNVVVTVHSHQIIYIYINIYTGTVMLAFKWIFNICALDIVGTNVKYLLNEL